MCKTVGLYSYGNQSIFFLFLILCSECSFLVIYLFNQADICVLGAEIEPMLCGFAVILILVNVKV